MLAVKRGRGAKKGINIQYIKQNCIGNICIKFQRISGNVSPPRRISCKGKWKNLHETHFTKGSILQGYILAIQSFPPSIHDIYIYLHFFLGFSSSRPATPCCRWSRLTSATWRRWPPATARLRDKPSSKLSSTTLKTELLCKYGFWLDPWVILC